MNPSKWKIAAKWVLVLCILFALGAAAWYKADFNIAKPSAAPDDTDKADQARTKEIFDPAKIKGLLAIRYFYLPGDVAQGDCILIQSPDGKNMLIDSGNPGVGPAVVNYLNQLGVNEINIALNTHPHSDHIGGFASIAKAKKIDQFYMENVPYSSNAYTGTLAALRVKNVPIDYLEEGDSFDLGDLHFEVLSPGKGDLAKAVKQRKQDEQGDSEAAIYNYFSLVVKMTYKNNAFLFGGDIYQDREQELIQKYGSKLDVDFAHVDHHGWNTSSGYEWIKTLSPQFAVASNNIFSTLDVMKRYDNYKTKIFITRFNGNIMITSDGSKLKAITEKDQTTLPPGFLKNQ